MIVMKFGGTSNEDAAAMRNVIRIVNTHLKFQPVVVISAIARATNELEQIARTAALGEEPQALELVESLIRRHLSIIRDLIKNSDRATLLEATIEEYRMGLSAQVSRLAVRKMPDPRSMDAICSYGERLSSCIVAAGLEDSGITASWVDVKDFMLTDDNFGRARPLTDQVQVNLRTVMLPLIRDGVVPVTQGFIGMTRDGDYTTMGRESSDYSATIVGALLPAKKVQIWTDVDGILTADPRIVPSVRKVRRMSFEEALQLSLSGAKVLHPTTMIPVLEKEIPVQILNSKREQGSGTLVEVASFVAKGLVKSIAHKRNMVLLAYTGSDGDFWSRVVPGLSSRGITPLLCSVSGGKTLLLMERASADAGLLEEMRTYGEVTLWAEKSSVTLVGDGISAVVGKASAIAAEGNIWMMSGPLTSTSLTYVIDTKHLEHVLLKLHRVFIEEVPDPEIFDPVSG
jgi:aspartate kinase